MKSISIYENLILESLLSVFEEYDKMMNESKHVDFPGVKKMYGINSLKEYREYAIDFNKMKKKFDLEESSEEKNMRNNTITGAKRIYDLFCKIFSYATQYFEMVDTGGERWDKYFLYAHPISFFRNINFHHKYTKHGMNYMCDKENIFYFFDKNELWFQFSLSVQDETTYSIRNVLNIRNHPYGYGMLMHSVENYFDINKKLLSYFEIIPADIIEIKSTAVSRNIKGNPYEKQIKIKINVVGILVFLFSPNNGYLFKQTQ